MVSGDSFITERDIRRIDLCKIDVEGAEMDVLFGLNNSLRSGLIKKIVVEVNRATLDRSGTRSNELVSRLSENYALYSIRRRERVLSDDDVVNGENLIGFHLSGEAVSF
jgi:hypothetical protein